VDEGLNATLAFVGAGLLALVTVPIARWIAIATDFLDHPQSYKKHARAIPYLGGAGVMAAFVIVGLVADAGDSVSGFTTVLAMTFCLCVMGTVDDRRTLPPGVRFLIQAGAGAVLWAGDIRWQPFGVPALDFLVTIVWVAGLTNAFNLLDNIDGASGTTGAVSAAGIGAVALSEGSGTLAAIAFALSGACAVFLAFNLTDRRKLFLGDGGSMPLGFLIAGLAMMLPTGLGDVAILAAVPLAGVAIFDTSLVVVSRRRRGVGVLVGGRDHSTHRLLRPLGSPARVALVLGLAQAALGALAILMSDMSNTGVLIASCAYIAVGLWLIVLFEGPAFAPEPGSNPVAARAVGSSAAPSPADAAAVAPLTENSA
jgi:UDP-GlcNAc:undecaprenyl-phosphate/decaprenyl-phosphate GlcNAc-1-phosphate transferase